MNNRQVMKTFLVKMPNRATYWIEASHKDEVREYAPKALSIRELRGKLPKGVQHISMHYL